MRPNSVRINIGDKFGHGIGVRSRQQGIQVQQMIDRYVARRDRLRAVFVERDDDAFRAWFPLPYVAPSNGLAF